MKRIEKRSAVVFGVIFFCLIFLTVCLVFVGLGHDCLGEHCRVCCVIDNAQKLLAGVTLLAAVSAFITAAFTFNSKRFLSVFKKLFSFSLISLKTKLSD